MADTRPVGGPYEDTVHVRLAGGPCDGVELSVEAGEGEVRMRGEDWGAFEAADAAAKSFGGPNEADPAEALGRLLAAFDAARAGQARPAHGTVAVYRPRPGDPAVFDFVGCEREGGQGAGGR